MKIAVLFTKREDMEESYNQDWEGRDTNDDAESVMKALKELGHEVDIKWANEIQPGEYDLVMVHVANLALELASNNVSYVFQHHDHHAYHYGKDSTIYKQNKEAMEKSIFSLVPARYLVDYFDLPNVSYLSLGVDNSFFKPKNDCIQNTRRN